MNEILQENEDRGVWTYVEYDGGDTIIETTDPSDYGVLYLTKRGDKWIKN